MCDVAYQALSQLVQQWEGPGDKDSRVALLGIMPLQKIGFIHLELPLLRKGRVHDVNMQWAIQAAFILQLASNRLWDSCHQQLSQLMSIIIQYMA